MQLTAHCLREGGSLIHQVRLRQRQCARVIPDNLRAIERHKRRGRLRIPAPLGMNVTHTRTTQVQRVTHANARVFELFNAGGFDSLRALHPGERDLYRHIQRDPKQQHQQYQQRAACDDGVAQPVL